MLSASMLIFGTIGLFRRAIALPSALIAFFRGAIGCAALLLFVALRRRALPALPRRLACLLALSGALIGVNWIFLFEAYDRTSVSVATLCYYMAPTFVIVLSALLLREKMTAKKALCALLALVGMALVSGVAETGLPPASELRGILFGLAAALLYAAVVLLNKSLPAVDPYAKTTLQLGLAALVLVPYLLAVNAFSAMLWDARTLGLLLVVGVLHTALCYALYFASMDGLKTQTVALFSYIDPVAALLLSALLLHETLTPLGIFGALLILGSAVVGELGE